MARFEAFRLQSVLNYKHDIVEQLEAEFGRLQQAYLSEVSRLELLKANMQQSLQALQGKLAGQLDFGAIRLHQDHVMALEVDLALQEQRVAEAQAAVEAKRSTLVAAMQEEKTLDTLREKHDTVQKREMARYEAGVVDEMVTARYRASA